MLKLDMDVGPSLVRFGNLVATHVFPAGRKSDVPILFVHGAMGGRWQFKNWQNYCAERGWESYALDLRGHRESFSSNLGNISIKDYADDVRQVIDTIGTCYLVGHSMGGLIAQVVASRDSRVQKAVFIASAPPAGILFMNSFLLAMVKYLSEFLFHEPVLLSKKDAVKFLLNRLDPESYETLVPESGRACADMAFTRVRSVRCPTLVVAARCDRLLPITVQKKIAKKYNAEYREVDSGHLATLERGWEEPILSILEWFT